MPKKVYAVTNVKMGQEEGDYFAAGDPLDVSKFTKEQLSALHDEGAIEIRVVDEEPEMTEPEEMVPAEAPEAEAEVAAPAEEAAEPEAEAEAAPEE